MKYSILNNWVHETNIISSPIEYVTLNERTVRIWFSHSTSLIFVNLCAEFFPYIDCNTKLINKSPNIFPNLIHAVWDRIDIAENDRIIYLYFSTKDIYQQNNKYCLIAECMTPMPNLILTHIENNQFLITDALIKYTYAENHQRQIIANIPYIPPITSYTPVQEITQPIIYLKDGSCIIGNCFNELLMNYHVNYLQKLDNIQKINQSLEYWKRELNKLNRKLDKQQDEMHQAEQLHKWLVFSETIKYNLTNISKGQSVLNAIDYFNGENNTIEIPLLPDKTPLQNMQYYLKKYHKAKQGKDKIAEQIEFTQDNILRINNLISSIKQGETSPIIPTNIKGQSSIKTIKLIDKLLRININNEWEIIIGRKAKENDLISTQIGKPNDWWFHTRIYHGSHILLRSLAKKELTQELLIICSSLAAWFSKAKFSQNVPVDYTQIRFVRKPRKSAPGFVTYTNHKTIYADPMDIKTIKSKYGL